MNHNDIMRASPALNRYSMERESPWNTKMIADWKKDGLHIILFASPEFIDGVPHPTKRHYFITIKEGGRSDIECIKNSQLVEQVLANHDTDPSTNIFARIADGDPKVEKMIYDFSPVLKAVADAWNLSETEKTQFEKILANSPTRPTRAGL